MRDPTIHGIVSRNNGRHSRESGNPERHWIPPYQVRGRRVKPGMTNCLRLMSSCISSERLNWPTKWRS
jgi:hypothetical protein